MGVSVSWQTPAPGAYSAQVPVATMRAPPESAKARHRRMVSAVAASDRYAIPAGDLAEGRKTFETVGCMACHRIGNDRRGVDAVDADGTVKKAMDAASFRTHGPNLTAAGGRRCSPPGRSPRRSDCLVSHSG